MSTTTADFLLAFADDEHLMGQHHTEWIGVAPFLEEDLAFSSIGQDELGHAVALYELVLSLDDTEATDEAVDQLAFGRGASEYRSCHLAEYPTTDWAEALVRHWIYDRFEFDRWRLVTDSTLTPLRDVAVRAEREEVFHRRHADALIQPLLASPSARARLHEALAAVLPMVPSLLAPCPGESAAVADGVASASTVTLAEPLGAAIAERFDVGQPVFDLASLAPRTERSEHFAPMMSRMREVLDLDLHAQW